MHPFSAGYSGANTLSITTLIVMPFSITQLSIKRLSIMIFRKTKLSIVIC
jgi:hypothetical protein